MNDIGMDLYIAYEDGYKAGYAEAERKKKCKPITNADRLRAMTDEELASFITDDMCELLCGAPLVLGALLGCDGQCKAKMLNWLKEEGNDGLSKPI